MNILSFIKLYSGRQAHYRVVVDQIVSWFSISVNVALPIQLTAFFHENKSKLTITSLAMYNSRNGVQHLYTSNSEHIFKF